MIGVYYFFFLFQLTSKFQNQSEEEMSNEGQMQCANGDYPKIIRGLKAV